MEDSNEKLRLEILEGIEEMSKTEVPLFISVEGNKIILPLNFEKIVRFYGVDYEIKGEEILIERNDFTFAKYDEKAGSGFIFFADKEISFLID
ncbi:hypothetical protein C9994_07925 [Marivirga lumbricoides]|uniref:Uncharacterized protein n=1 Tax=Marivirga lumbricoides TaxID=1046115 RepID=A0A2T4DR91_9BACT|nr:hypothetical protein C9994_07925 [Marivirga lumbricoides]